MPYKEPAASPFLAGEQRAGLQPLPDPRKILAFGSINNFRTFRPELVSPMWRTDGYGDTADAANYYNDDKLPVDESARPQHIRDLHIRSLKTNSSKWGDREYEDDDDDKTTGSSPDPHDSPLGARMQPVPDATAPAAPAAPAAAEKPRKKGRFCTQLFSTRGASPFF